MKYYICIRIDIYVYSNRVNTAIGELFIWLIKMKMVKKVIVLL